MVDEFTKTTLGIVPGVMAVGLLGESLKLVPRFKPMKPYSKPRMNPKPFGSLKPYKTPSSKPFVKGAVNILVGSALIGATSSAINKL